MNTPSVADEITKVTNLPECIIDLIGEYTPDCISCVNPSKYFGETFNPHCEECWQNAIETTEEGKCVVCYATGECVNHEDLYVCLECVETAGWC